MKKKLLERRAYVSPMCEVFVMETCNQLLTPTSFPNNGGHGKAGDDGDDDAGDDDGDIDDAKQGWFDEEEEEDTPQRWGI